MKARLPFGTTVAAVVLSSVVFGGVVGVWSVKGPALAVPAWVARSWGSCGTYENSSGHVVPSPCGNWRTGDIPSTGTAFCADGSVSSSEHRSGTCSHHGG